MNLGSSSLCLCIILPHVSVIIWMALMSMSDMTSQQPEKLLTMDCFSQLHHLRDYYNYFFMFFFL